MGILPAKPKEAEVTEEDLIRMVERTIKQKSGQKDLDELDLDELDELEDEEEERILLQMRMQRMAQMKALSEKSKYGSVREITAVDYVQEVNKAGDDVFVILHLYKQGVPLSALINEYMNRLAPKFPTTQTRIFPPSSCITRAR